MQINLGSRALIRHLFDFLCLFGLCPLRLPVARVLPACDARLHVLRHRAIPQEFLELVLAGLLAGFRIERVGRTQLLREVQERRLRA